MTHSVCHISTAHAPNDIRIFYKECLSLSSSGFEVHLVTHGEMPQSIAGSLHFHSLGTLPKSRFKRFRKAVNDAVDVALKTKASVFHIHDPELLRLAQKLKNSGAKVIYDAHEDLPRQIISKPYLPVAFRSVIGSLAEKLEKHLVAKVDAVVAATDIIAKRFSGLVTEVVAVKNYPIADNFLRIQHSHRDKVVVYAGAITEARGIFAMLEAIGKCQGVRLKLAGAFESLELESKVMAHKAWAQVEYLGVLSPKSIPDIYTNCIAGLVVLKPFQSYKEALPIKMFEYMAASLPVICSDFETWREIVEVNGCGFSVDPLNAENIADAIHSIANDLSLCEKMGQNGRKQVMDNFRWSTEYEKLKALYSNLLS